MMQDCGGMVVRERVVDGHVNEEWPDVLVEESLDDGVVEARVDEDSTNVGFDDVRQALKAKC